MVLIKLKDANVVNIIDDLEEYTGFGGTFNPDIVKHMTNFTLELEDGRVVALKSIELGYYSDPIGIADAAPFIIDVLRVVTSGDASELTLAQFIAWIIENHVTEGIVIEVTSSGATKKGFVENSVWDDSRPHRFVNKEIKEHINSRKRNRRIDPQIDPQTKDYAFLAGKVTELAPKCLEVVEVNVADTPEDSSVTKVSLGEFLHA